MDKKIPPSQRAHVQVLIRISGIGISGICFPGTYLSLKTGRELNPGTPGHLIIFGLSEINYDHAWPGANLPNLGMVQSIEPL